MLDTAVNCNDLEWQDAGDPYYRGTQVKILREDDEGRTVILKLPPGFRMEGHTHIHNEQHFILKGEYEMNGQTFTEGTYQLIHTDMTHGPFTSKNGAEVLIIWHK